MQVPRCKLKELPTDRLKWLDEHRTTVRQIAGSKPLAGPSRVLIKITEDQESAAFVLISANVR